MPKQVSFNTTSTQAKQTSSQASSNHSKAATTRNKQTTNNQKCHNQSSCTMQGKSDKGTNEAGKGMTKQAATTASNQSATVHNPYTSVETSSESMAKMVPVQNPYKKQKAHQNGTGAYAAGFNPPRVEPNNVSSQHPINAGGGTIHFSQCCNGVLTQMILQNPQLGNTAGPPPHQPKQEAKNFAKNQAFDQSQVYEEERAMEETLEDAIPCSPTPEINGDPDSNREQHVIGSSIMK
jgi:hypothetical protein